MTMIIQAMFCCHHQAYCWYTYHLVEIYRQYHLKTVFGNGINSKDVLMPHWLTGRQITSFVSRRTKNWIVADSRHSRDTESEDSPKPKIRKKE